MEARAEADISPGGSEAESFHGYPVPCTPEEQSVCNVLLHADDLLTSEQPEAAGVELLRLLEARDLTGAAAGLRFEDASPGLERKVAAMAAYESELREWPHPRSLEGIRVAARRWGMTVGLEAAEHELAVDLVLRAAQVDQADALAPVCGLDGVGHWEKVLRVAWPR